MSDPVEVTDVGLPERRQLGRYALRYRVADGGMGAVYLAQLRGGEGFEKWVAIKVVHEHVARDANFVRMFLDEARIAARINHPNVAQVFDCGVDDGAHYMAMEYLHGEPLNSVVKAGWRDGSISPALAARIVVDAARGLHAAHELKSVDGTPAGVVHRDVSPQNIFVLYDGDTEIVDFGIARARRTARPIRPRPTCSRASWGTWRPSRSTARRSTAARTSGRWASCCGKRRWGAGSSRPTARSPR